MVGNNSVCLLSSLILVIIPWIWVLDPSNFPLHINMCICRSFSVWKDIFSHRTHLCGELKSEFIFDIFVVVDAGWVTVPWKSYRKIKFINFGGKNINLMGLLPRKFFTNVWLTVELGGCMLFEFVKSVIWTMPIWRSRFVSVLKTSLQ